MNAVTRSGSAATDPTPAAPRNDSPPAGRSRSLQSFLKPELAILPVLVVVIIVGAVLNPAFVSYSNIFGIMQQTAELGVLVMGLTLVLVTGKFDLSLESTFGLAPMAGAYVFLSLDGSALGLLDSPFAALLGIFVVGALIGLFNSVLVVYLRFNAFIATLATLILLRASASG